MRSWAIARLPSEAAKCNGVLESRGLTGELTSSWEAWASTKATDFISDLKQRKKFNQFNFPRFFCKNCKIVIILVRVSKFPNELLKSSFIPKYEPEILTKYNIWFIF